MAPRSNRSNSGGELNAEECEFVEDYLEVLRDSPETEHPGVGLGDYTTATMILPPERSDDELEGNIINIFRHLISGAENDLFADLVVQSSADNDHHVGEAGLDFSLSRAGMDLWIWHRIWQILFADLGVAGRGSTVLDMDIHDDYCKVLPPSCFFLCWIMISTQDVSWFQGM